MTLQAKAVAVPIEPQWLLMPESRDLCGPIVVLNSL